MRLLVLAAVLVGCAGDARNGPEGALLPTFSGGVARVLHENCTICHRPGGAAPFALLSYEDAREHGRRIASMTDAREMPPWPPSRPVDAFVDERGLAQEEIDLLKQWVDDGMPVGDPAAVPLASIPSDGWRLGTPDLVLEMEGSYTVPAAADEIFRNFILPVPLDSARWIRAVELEPGSARVVHHATLAVDRTDGSREMDAHDAEPGFDGMGAAGGADHPAGVFIGWTPGRSAVGGASGATWRLLPGSDLVARLHLRPVDEPVEVRPRVALYFADGRPERPPVAVQLGAQSMDIPAGEPAYEVRDSFMVSVDLDVLSLYPHAHYLGDTVQAWAETPAGERVWLLEIPAWDFDWQDEYRFRDPVFLPAGSTLFMRYTFDNSSRNPRNPSDPPVRVTYGHRSVDEMADLVVQTLPRTREGSLVLQRAVDQKVAEIKLGGYRLAIAEGREDAPLRYNMGIAEAARGRSAEAEAHFRAALRLDPELVEAFVNLGIVLHQQNRVAEAAEHYARAVALSPSEARAHHNLGVALAELGRAGEAESHFRQATLGDPAFALAHESLGELLQGRGDHAGAAASFRRSLESDPERVDVRMGLGAALAQMGDGVGALESFRAAAALAPESARPLLAMADLLAGFPDSSVRQPAEAVRLARQAVELTRRGDPVALFTLTIALASAGDLRQALSTGEEAMAIARQAGNAALVQAIEARLARYRQGRP